MRQGDPLSPYLFVTVVEILAIAVRNQANIKGIEINCLETKLLQFADDTTAVLSDLNSARALFKLLDRFEIPWVPEAFLARFPVEAYVSEKKTSGTQGRFEKASRSNVDWFSSVLCR